MSQYLSPVPIKYRDTARPCGTISPLSLAAFLRRYRVVPRGLACLRACGCVHTLLCQLLIGTVRYLGVITVVSLAILYIFYVVICGTCVALSRHFKRYW